MNIKVWLPVSQLWNLLNTIEGDASIGCSSDNIAGNLLTTMFTILFLIAFVKLLKLSLELTALDQRGNVATVKLTFQNSDSNSCMIKQNLKVISGKV